MPIDILKSITQRHNGGKTVKITQILINIYKMAGFRGLYTGLGPRLARVGFDRAIGFLVFESIMEKMSN